MRRKKFKILIITNKPNGIKIIHASPRNDINCGKIPYTASFTLPIALPNPVQMEFIPVPKVTASAKKFINYYPPFLQIHFFLFSYLEFV
jgi:hypothetical protein